MYQKEHLGSLLVRAGIISDEDLKRALDEADRTEQRLGQVLIAMGLTTESQIQTFLGIQLGVPAVKLEHSVIDPEIAKSIPEKFARRHGVLPLYRGESAGASQVVVAMTDPANIMVQDELTRELGEVFIVTTTQAEMSRFLDRVWLGAAPEAAAPTVVLPASTKAAEEVRPSVALILEMLFKKSFELRATSIHLEPKQKFVAVRYKVDGVYHSVTSLPKETYQAVLTRIKILSKMTVAETVMEIEEGRFHIRPDLAAPFIDVRVTVVPAVFGEKAVLRITRRDDIIRPLDAMGFEPSQWPVIVDLLKKTAGLLLITGKNDSGKTTLAYSILSQIGDPSNMVVTVEDPASYPISGFNQVAKFRMQKTELTRFEQTLRAVEMQEPNIVYISSVDTNEETRMMLRLASTGRRVLGTLYADDATSSHWVTLQQGADPYAVASALSGVVGCRLVRKICPHCRIESKPSEEARARLNLKPTWMSGKLFHEGAGCEICSHTGYLGREGVYEIMPAFDHIKDMIESRAPSDMVRKTSVEAGMMSFRDAALAKVERGITTLSEVAERIG